MRKLISRIVTLFLLIIVSAALSGCDIKKVDEPVVARIEDRFITADEFAYAFELSPRQLTSLEKRDARLAVLDRLTDRILLAREAEDLGLAEKDTVFQRALDLYKRKAVNRELYEKHIRNPISISEVQEREAFRRSKTTYYVKHFVSDNIKDAENVSRGIREFDHKPLFPGVKSTEYGKFGKVDILQWSDIPSNLEDIIVNLPLYSISEPFFDGVSYHIFQIVEQEHELLIRENDFLANRESIHGILIKRAESVASSAFIQDVMEPQNLIIKADALNGLTDYLWNNRPANIDPKAEYIPGEEIQFVSQRKSDIGRRKIAEFRDGDMTVNDILFHYKVNPQKVSYAGKLALRESLKNAVALYVRDWVFSEKGIAERLDRLPSVKEEVQTRKEYLLAKKMITHLYKDSAVAELSDKELQQILNSHICELKENADIQIFEEQLMAVKTSDEGLPRKIDFIAVQTQ